MVDYNLFVYFRSVKKVRLWKMNIKKITVFINYMNEMILFPISPFHAAYF
jgi:hypothetical protein